VRFFWIAIPASGRVWLIQADSQSEAAIEAFKLNGIVIREAL
jgi:hypothetical protein